MQISRYFLKPHLWWNNKYATLLTTGIVQAQGDVQTELADKGCTHQRALEIIKNKAKETQETIDMMSLF